MTYARSLRNTAGFAQGSVRSLRLTNSNFKREGSGTNRRYKRGAELFYEDNWCGGVWHCALLLTS
eukprot:501470-Pyramimonas_sp.AAC.2